MFLFSLLVWFLLGVSNELTSFFKVKICKYFFTYLIV